MLVWYNADAATQEKNMARGGGKQIGPPVTARPPAWEHTASHPAAHGEELCYNTSELGGGEQNSDRVALHCELHRNAHAHARRTTGHFARYAAYILFYDNGEM
jgi:hypothetical protein